MIKIVVYLLIIIVFFAVLYSFVPSIKQQKSTNITTTNKSELSVVADNLEVPWDIVFLPDKSILFTERQGSIRIINPDGSLKPEPILQIEDVNAQGEGGLLGMELHPNFANNKYVYAYYTYSSQNNNTLNRVVRYTYNNGTLTYRQIIINAIPGASLHNGGRIRFGPDKYLYITTGDAQNPSQAQNFDSLAGKILRTTDEGQMATGNPFNNLIYSYGHRNPQGLTWDSNGRLWATEHGSSAHDEINLIESGKNYGWPEISGTQEKSGMVTAVIESGEETWAPSGADYKDGQIYFTGLRGQALFRFNPNVINKNVERFLEKEYGRLRTVKFGPDGDLYLLTNNKDGRGFPSNNDDRIIRINPSAL